MCCCRPNLLSLDKQETFLWNVKCQWYCQRVYLTCGVRRAVSALASACGVGVRRRRQPAATICGDNQRRQSAVSATICGVGDNLRRQSAATICGVGDNLRRQSAAAICSNSRTADFYISALISAVKTNLLVERTKDTVIMFMGEPRKRHIAAHIQGGPNRPPNYHLVGMNWVLVGMTWSSLPYLVGMRGWLVNFCFIDYINSLIMLIVGASKSSS